MLPQLLGAYYRVAPSCRPISNYLPWKPLMIVAVLEPYSHSQCARKSHDPTYVQESRAIEKWGSYLKQNNGKEGLFWKKNNTSMQRRTFLEKISSTTKKGRIQPFNLNEGTRIVLMVNSAPNVFIQGQIPLNNPLQASLKHIKGGGIYKAIKRLSMLFSKPTQMSPVCQVQWQWYAIGNT